MASREVYESIGVEQLYLDPQNPRLPETLAGRPQAELVEYLYRTAVLDELAYSMLDNGYFKHEPLIVANQPTGDGEYVVLEGNRRLAALMILHQLPAARDAEVIFNLDPSPTGEQLERLKSVDCVIVPSPEAVHDFLGFRHIGGIKTWSPEAKARYLLREVERVRRLGVPGNIFTEVGRRVGSNAQGVRNPYVALKILMFARTEYGVESTDVQLHRFGVWTRCMNSAELREYIGFGNARTYDDVEAQLQGLREDHLREVISDLTSPGRGRRPVLADSRDVTVYASVLTNDRAREALRKYEDLFIARQVVDRAAMPARIERLIESIEVLRREVESDGAPREAVEPAKRLERVARSFSAVVGAEPSD